MKGTITAAQAAYAKFKDNPSEARRLFAKVEQRTRENIPALNDNPNLSHCWAGVRVGLHWAANSIVPQGASAAEWRSMLRNKR